MDREPPPRSALSKRILDLGRKIDEIERVLATWPAEDAEDSFIRALGASLQRLREELEQTRALLDRQRRANHASDIPEDLTPADALDVSPARAAAPPNAGIARKQHPPDSSKTHVFRIPWARDFEVTDEEWDHIQAILGSRSPEG